jgi:hypothetical protein
MRAGWVVVGVGVLLTVLNVMAGGNLVPLAFSLLGLLLVATGFGVRVLAAVDGQRRPLHD